MKDWYDKLLLLSRDHAREFVTNVYKHLKSDSKLRPDVQKLEETTAKVLGEQLAVSQEEMKGRIEETRRTLHERIPERVRGALKPAFEKAGKETGKGMRDRIIETHLRPAALTVARDVFGEAEAEINRELRVLQDALTRSYGQMADTVRRHAKTNADNFWQDAHELSLDAIEYEKKQLQAAADILTALMAA